LGNGLSMATDLEKALRLIEKRKGDLLGEAVEGRPPKNLPRAEGSKLPFATANRYRALARWWEPLLRPIVLKATAAPRP